MREIFSPFIFIEPSDIILQFLVMLFKKNVDSQGQMVTLRFYHNKNAHSSWRRLTEPVAGGAQCSVDAVQWPGVLSGLKVPFAVALHFLGDLT